MAAKELQKRLGLPREAPVRYSFMRRESADDPLPPLVSVLRTRRGADVRLKLYLSYLWLAVADPHDITGVPARYWAQLIGLEDPDNNGARQVRSANAWLEQQHLIGTTPVPGEPTTIVLREESGRDVPYTLPGLAYKTSRKATKPRHRYIKIPAGMWLNGWIANLKAPAIAMYLILSESARGNDGTQIWHARSVIDKHYGISETVRSHGLSELRDHGIIVTNRRAVISRTSMDKRRARNAHLLYHSTLESPVKQQASEPSQEAF